MNTLQLPMTYNPETRRWESGVHICIPELRNYLFVVGQAEPMQQVSPIRKLVTVGQIGCSQVDMQLGDVLELNFMEPYSPRRVGYVQRFTIKQDGWDICNAKLVEIL